MSPSQIDESIVKLSGTKVAEKQRIGDYGWSANFKDPEGSRFGVFEANWGAKQ